MSARVLRTEERRTGNKWKRRVYRVRQHVAVWWITGLFIFAAWIKFGGAT